MPGHCHGGPGDLRKQAERTVGANLNPWSLLCFLPLLLLEFLPLTSLHDTL